MWVVRFQESLGGEGHRALVSPLEADIVLKEQLGLLMKSDRSSTGSNFAYLLTPGLALFAETRYSAYPQAWKEQLKGCATDVSALTELQKQAIALAGDWQQTLADAVKSTWNHNRIVLADSDFQTLMEHSLWTQIHNKINKLDGEDNEDDSEGGAEIFWTDVCIPIDTILYYPWGYKLNKTNPVANQEHDYLMDVVTVWEWVQQALSVHGVGSRTSAGYGQIKAPSSFRPSAQLRQAENGSTTKTFEFKLYSQGCAGANRQQQDFRPSHWRGWLRSWILRFLLGIMSKDNAEKTLWELMGTIEPDTRKGCLKIRMIPDQEIWGERSINSPYFYVM